jgi:hypothetical protein
MQVAVLNLACEGGGVVMLDSITGVGIDTFIDRCGDTRAKQELLLFWALHPDARFSRLAILSALECSKLDAEKALTYMVDIELVNTHSDRGVTTYSLTLSEKIRQMLAQLNTLDWGQRYKIFSHIHQVPGACSLVSRQEGI